MLSGGFPIPSYSSCIPISKTLYLREEQDIPTITNRMLCPTLYSAMDYFQEQGNHYQPYNYMEIPF